MCQIQGLRQDGPFPRVISTADAARQLQTIMERVRDEGEDFLITDDEGNTLGLVVNAELAEELGEFLSLAQNAYGRLQGEKPTPHDEFAQEMGIQPAADDSMRKQQGRAA